MGHGVTGGPLVDVVRDYFDAINAHDWDAVARLTTPELSTVVRDAVWRGHPDLHVDVDWISQHDDKVSAWCYFRGTHTADWALQCSAENTAAELIAPTGRSWRVACSTTYRVTHGRIVDVWSVWDWMGLLDQLGVLRIAPSGPSAPIPPRARP